MKKLALALLAPLALALGCPSQAPVHPGNVQIPVPGQKPIDPKENQGAA